MPMLETTMSEPEFPDSGWKILSSQVVFQGWLTVARDRLRKPDGGEMDYTYVASSDAAAVLADPATIVGPRTAAPGRGAPRALPGHVVQARSATTAPVARSVSPIPTTISPAAT